MKKTKKNTRQRQESNDYYVDMKFNVLFFILFYAMCIVVVFMFQFSMRVIGVVGCAVILVKLVIGMLKSITETLIKYHNREGILITRIILVHLLIKIREKKIEKKLVFLDGKEVMGMGIKNNKNCI